jgi:hypothetical protein
MIMHETADTTERVSAPNMIGSEKRVGLTLGWKVFGGLIALSLLEYWAAAMAEGPIPYPVLCGLLAPITWVAIFVSRNPLPILGIAAIAKAVLIVQYFMHVRKAWSQEGGR